MKLFQTQTFPKVQFVLARTRGRKTQFFYGPKIGALMLAHIKVGDLFQYAKQTTSGWRIARRTSKTTYTLEA